MAAELRLASKDLTAALDKDLSASLKAEAAAVSELTTARLAGNATEIATAQAKVAAATTTRIAAEQSAFASKSSLSSARAAAGEDVSLATKAKDNWVKIAGGAGAAAFGAYCLAKYIQSSKTKRTITKIEQYFGTTVKITFSPAIKITIADSMNISGTHCSPNIDIAAGVPQSSPSDSQILYDPGFALTDLTAGGTIDVSTSFLAQVGSTASDAVKAIGSPLFGGLSNGVASAGIVSVGSISSSVILVIAFILLKK